MKKYNKLFAILFTILFAVLGVGTLSAQTWTDVTSTYIKNPTLIEEYYSKSDNTAWPVYTTGRTGNTQHPKNWILHTNGTTNHNIGGEFFECWKANQGVKRWTLFQDVTLPAGQYKLTGKYSTNENRGIIKTVAITPHHSYYSPGITTGNWGSWGIETAEFTIYEETQVRVGMISTNFAQCNGFTLTTTGAKQLLADEIAAAPEDLTEAVATAQGVYDDSNSDETAYRNAAKSLNDAIVAYNIENASESTPVDMTDRIANPSFEGIGGTTAYTGAKHNCSEWTYTANTDAGARSVTGSDYLNTDDSNDAFYCFNTWGGNAFNVSQTLKNMPAGNYKLSACYSSDANNTAILYLNSTETGITLTATSKHTFVEDFYTYKLAVDGDLVIGMTSSKWYKVDDFKLQFLGADLTVLQEAFAENYSNLQGLSTDNVPTAFANKISNLLSTYATVPNNKKDLQIANTSISTIVSDHPSIVAAYANLNTYVSTHDNSVEIESGAKAIFKAVIDKAVADADNAVTVEEINNVIPALEAARQIYVQKADPTNDTYFDYTFKIKDPAVVDGNGWTGKRTSSGQQYTGAPDNTYLDSWNGSGQNIYQEIANLPSGLYTLKAAGRASTGCTSAYIYLNDTKAEFEKVGSEGNDLGQGWKWYTTEKTAVAGTAKVGFGCNTTSEQWAGADDFHLYYYGFDVTTAQNSVATLKSEAEALVGKPMNAKISTALNSAITDADASKETRQELEPMIAALSTAIANANASIAAYEAISAYIAKANNMDESIAAEYQTAYDDGTLESAETVFQELEVATYDYVKDEFSYPVELPAGNWVAEGPTGSKSEQHWSGEQRSYLEQSSTAWGQNAWSISYKQDKTLPAGDYVFKVSGRRAEGTGNTLSLVVTNINDPENPVELGVVNDFPEGDTGLGINKNGETSFDAEDEAGFANDGNGRGWQWRYVKFTLTDETTVQVAVEAEATTNHQWISFCDATLQMTEETYLEANKGALDAPTAEANALVDTNPMGTEENTALKDALALPVTTGAELLAKIEALETAVANANAWVAAYNEAKAPLVAALERFETELNDGVNGCKYNMVEDEDVWATLITEVGEAACTKDVTNDYYSFANAAEKLNNAIDEVHNWIRTNPTLNAKSATAVDMTDYYLVNASFDEGNTNGWEKTGSQTNNVAWSVTDGTFTATPSGSHYTGDAIWQKVNLAKGAYKLTVNLKAQEVAGHPSQVFVAGAAPSWNNNLSDLIASVKVTEFNKDIELSCIFNVATDADVYIGFNQKSGNVAGTGIKGSYTIYDFTLTQAANQIITKDGVITVVGENEAADLAGISSDENIVTVDLTGATWNEASTLSIVNNNSLVYVTDDANLTANNIVKVGVDEEGNTTRVAKSIVLTEGYKFSAREAFTATALNYAREFSANNWLTVCLPFAYEIPEGVKVETLGAVDLDTKTFTFNEVTGTMEANKPYIIKNSSETAALFAELGDVTVEATPEAMTVEVTAEGSEHKAEFIGTYTAVKTDALMENGAYDILFFGSDGQLYFLSQGVTTKNVNIKPFRAYIRLPKDAINWSDGQQAIARHGGGTTDIEDAELTNDGASVIYDLMGRKVNTIEKGGMYIVNGKKVVIR